MRTTRRGFLSGMGAVGASVALGLSGSARAQRPSITGSVGIVGAGLAGLHAAFTLEEAGVGVSLYEAGTRIGGRQFSGVLGGQTMERGGELIDNLHKEMLGWVNRLGLQVEDLSKQPGDVIYAFDGVQVPESTIVDEYRVFVASIQEDLRASTGQPTAFSSNAADQTLDRLSLLEYLETRGAGARVKQAIIAAYEAEYGLDAAEQSALGFLLFIHADKRSKFTPFGVFSDERYHVIGGNDQIATGIHAHLMRPAELNHRLVRVRDMGSSVELTFDTGNRTVTRTHDRVILAIPFSVLRNVELMVDMPAQKRLTIDTLGYGDNVKTMVGFQRPYWRDLGSNGACYANAQNVQVTWETSPTEATTTHAILTDYASGTRGRSLRSDRVQQQVGAFVSDLDRVFPGAALHAVRDRRGRFEAHLEPWPTNPLSRGSYTCYRPGQFTTLCGLESVPVGRVHFAGEHANSFYEWQGFMEGALRSGIDAAQEVLAERG